MRCGGSRKVWGEAGSASVVLAPAGCALVDRNTTAICPTAARNPSTRTGSCVDEAALEEAWAT